MSRKTPAREQLARIRLLVLDFDGVLTDNRVLVDEDGGESVFCHRGDGLGLQMLRDAGVEPFVLSKERNPVVGCSARLKAPRVKRSAIRRRTSGSRVSMPAGKRQRISRPRAFTLFTSQVQLSGPSWPIPLANPVMLAMGTISSLRCRRRLMARALYT